MHDRAMRFTYVYATHQVKTYFPRVGLLHSHLADTITVECPGTSAISPNIPVELMTTDPGRRDWPRAGCSRQRAITLPSLAAYV